MQKWRGLLISLLGILLLGISYLPSVYHYNQASQNASHFQAVLSQKEKVLSEKLQKLHLLDSKGLIHEVDRELNQQYYQTGYSYFIFHERELAYWSEDATSVEDSLLLSRKALLRSENGVHEKLIHQFNDSVYVGLILIKHDYSYENRFLKNDFHPDFQFPQIRGISNKMEEGVEIVGHNGENLLSLKASSNDEQLSIFQYMIGGLGILGALLLLLFLPYTFRQNKTLYHTSSILLAFLLRLLLWWKLPISWQDWPLFHSNSFALSNWTPSLGDFSLHLGFLIFAIYHWKAASNKFKSKGVVLLNLSLATFFSIFGLIWIQAALSNSIITYDLNNLLELNVLSYLSFFCFALIFFIPLLLLETSLNQLHKRYGAVKSFAVFALFQLITLILFYAFDYSVSLGSLWLFIPALIFIAKARRKWQRSLGAPILLLLSISLLTVFTIRENSKSKESNQQKLILKKLSEEKDPVAEYLFSEIQAKLSGDDYLKELIKDYWSHQEVVDQYLRENYFKGFWDKYSMVFTPCQKGDSLYLSSGDTYANCRDYFMERLRREGEVVSSNNFFQLQNFPGQIEYLAEVEIPLDSNDFTLFIELSSNFLSENQGYPELLLDAKSREANLDLSDYSYAIYEKEELVYHHGSYNYSSLLKIAELSNGSFYKYSSSENDHLAYQKDEETTLILSHSTFTTLNYLTSWAYLFVLFSVLFGLCCLIFPHFPFYFNLSFTDFSTKIQFFLIGSLLVALVLFSLGTTYYIQEQYQEKNFKNLSEKLRSVNVELEQKIGMEEFLADPLQPYISGLLIKFSNVFYSDINFYDKNGRLYASSRPEVFEKGLKSRRMDPIAYEALVLDRKSEWVQEESIGEMNYLSAYIPFRNYDNQVLAYLNLPYFSKQDELQEEISSFLVSTINIYVGIFTLALLVSVLLINQLSKPLLLIRKQIGRLKLGSSVELIDWNSQDEIGALVQEYNRIAIELNESAEQLAQSEREGAWREMAKQVAHEIKNPLTPMKLSIQHLQRAAESNPEQFKERLQRTTQTLIEQIDTLSNIANAFSTFAKLPEKELKPVDLIPLLQNATHLYDQEVAIEFNNLSQQAKAMIEGDKDQLLRLFNNLIKNAVHAIQEKEEGKIEVRLSKHDETYVVEIEDNGTGIPKEQQARIFEPNFTTKSSGTGLGLAMAKNIVKHMHGKIKVKSEKGKGTVFYVEFKGD